MRLQGPLPEAPPLSRPAFPSAAGRCRGRTPSQPPVTGQPPRPEGTAVRARRAHPERVVPPRGPPVGSRRPCPVGTGPFGPGYRNPVAQGDAVPETGQASARDDLGVPTVRIAHDEAADE